MRENPSKGYIDWALSRFGPEWVEAHLYVNCDCDGAPTEQNCPDCQGENIKPVEIEKALQIPTPNGENMAQVWAREQKKVVLSTFQHSALPSPN